MPSMKFGMHVRLDWYGNQRLKEFEKMMWRRLKTAASYLRREMIRKVSRGKTRVDGPSLPGQPPHIDTGDLRKSIGIEMLPAGTFRGMQANIGTTMVHGYWLEVGTMKMAPRPWARSTFNESFGTIVDILHGGKKPL